MRTLSQTLSFSVERVYTLQLYAPNCPENLSSKISFLIVGLLTKTASVLISNSLGTRRALHQQRGENMRKVIISMMVLFQFCSYGFASDSNSDEPKFSAYAFHDSNPLKPFEKIENITKENLPLDRIKCFKANSVSNPYHCSYDAVAEIEGHCEANGDVTMKDGRTFYATIEYRTKKSITRPWCKKLLPGLDCGESLADQYNERATVRASREKMESTLSSLKCESPSNASQPSAYSSSEPDSNESGDTAVSGEAR
jgi:hypothetical protein